MTLSVTRLRPEIPKIVVRSRLLVDIANRDYSPVLSSNCIALRSDPLALARSSGASAIGSSARLNHLYKAGADFVYMERIEAVSALAGAVGQALARSMDSHRSDLETARGAYHEREEIIR